MLYLFITFGMLVFSSLGGAEVETNGLHLQSRHSITCTSPVHFSLGVLDLESHKLFAWAGLELRYSCSQNPQINFFDIFVFYINKIYFV
jgi:hypothetical protein